LVHLLLIFFSNVKKQIEEGILLVNNESNSNCIGQHIMPYQEDHNNVVSKLKLSPMFSLDSISMWVALLAPNSITILGLIIQGQG
jgi:hypothetical protein